MVYIHFVNEGINLLSIDLKILVSHGISRNKKVKNFKSVVANGICHDNSR